MKPDAERPFMPDYGIKKGRKGLLDWDWVDERMQKSRNYWISTATPEGKPHAMPVWGVWLDGKFYFGTGRSSRKGRNLQASPQVVVHLESGDEVVVFEGVVEELTAGPEMERLVSAYAEKYPGYEPSPEPDPNSPFYVLRPRKAYAWREHDFPTSATRWRFP
jgi:nitroimidazol reductase NimA-like FMN-containing flavoprotein (pyridoxamine 5'-phosphate oxidase superfamily)